MNPKKRPSVVVSSAFYNRNRPDLVLMAATSQIRPSAFFGEVTITHWDKADLSCTLSLHRHII
jgi:mRNA interferase MazF